MVRSREKQAPAEASVLGAEAAGPRTLTSFMARHGLDGGVSLAIGGGNRVVAALLPDDGRRYDEGRLIARGGMGEVLRTHDRSIRRAVAMKVMLDPETATRQQLLRFIEEAQVTGQLEHPGIVPVHDLGVDEQDNVFYTMKLVRGTTLREILARLADRDPDAVARYPLSALLTIFQRVSDALAFAHSRGVIHRDLKPDNIMVGDFGEVLVLDWGLAKVLGGVGREGTEGMKEEPAIESARADADSEGDAVRTLDGQILGTPAFMSPEQAEGRIGEVGTPADIYSLGAILYAILTLRAPVEGRSVREILAKVGSGDITPPASYSGSAAAPRQQPAGPGAPAKAAPATPLGLAHCPGGRIPASLSAVAMKALARDPAARYPAVAALQAEIEAYQTGFATGAEQAGLQRQLVLLLQRHRTFALASVAVVLALAVGLGSALLQWRDADRARLAESAQRRSAEIARDEAEAARQAQVTLSRQAAPEFVTKAEMALYGDDLAKATTTAEFARVLDPESAAVHLLKARLLLAEGRVIDAVAPLQEAGRRAQGELRTKAEALLGAVQQIAARGARRSSSGIDTAALQSLAAVLDQGGDPFVAARLLKQAAPDSNRMEVTLKGAVEAMKHLNPQAAGVTYEMDAYGTVGNLTIRSATPVPDFDLTPLTGVPLGTVLLSGITPTSMAPLRGANLYELRVSEARSLDLAPLAGVPLEILVCDACGLRDLAPLSQMLALHMLSLTGCSEISSIEPLRGLRPAYLELGYLPGVNDLRPLAGMPVTTLLVYDCGTFADLAPLQGMRLAILRLANVTSADLTVLGDMPLASLHLTNVGATNWNALRGRRLGDLTLENLACDDISFIAGMPLDYLLLHGLRGLKDLRPLAGIPLRMLSLADCPDIADVTPLLELPRLERALLPWGRTLEPLRRHPTLRYAERSAVYLRPDGISRPVTEFWQDWTTAFGASTVDVAVLPTEDLATLWLAEIRTGLERDNPEAVPVQVKWGDAAGLPHGLFLNDNPRLSNLAALAGIPLPVLFLQNTAVSDLTPLRGMPLGGLTLANTPVTDLSPLADCPLRGLTLTDSSVTDLSPLRGMPLTTLHCDRTHVSDLGPLRGMNLTLLDVTGSRVSDLGPLAEVSVRTLNATGCPITDLTPLASVPCLRVLFVGETPFDLAPLAACRQLVIVCFPDGINDYTPLRQLPWLAQIDLKPADLLWFEVDRKPRAVPAPP